MCSTNKCTLNAHSHAHTYTAYRLRFLAREHSLSVAASAEIGNSASGRKLVGWNEATFDVNRKLSLHCTGTLLLRLIGTQEIASN